MDKPISPNLVGRRPNLLHSPLLHDILLDRQDGAVCRRATPPQPPLNPKRSSKKDTPDCLFVDTDGGDLIASSPDDPGGYDSDCLHIVETEPTSDSEPDPGGKPVPSKPKGKTPSASSKVNRDNPTAQPYRQHNLPLSDFKRKLSQCPICCLKYSSHKLANVCLTKHGKRQCWLCLDVMTNTKDTYQRHGVIHHAIQPDKNTVPCPYCNKYFDFRQGFNQHIVKVHFSHETILSPNTSALSPTTLVDIYTGTFKKGAYRGEQTLQNPTSVQPSVLRVTGLDLKRPEDTLSAAAPEPTRESVIRQTPLSIPGDGGCGSTVDGVCGPMEEYFLVPITSEDEWRISKQLNPYRPLSHPQYQHLEQNMRNPEEGIPQRPRSDPPAQRPWYVDPEYQVPRGHEPLRPLTSLEGPSYELLPTEQFQQVPRGDISPDDFHYNPSYIQSPLNPSSCIFQINNTAKVSVKLRTNYSDSVKNMLKTVAQCGPPESSFISSKIPNNVGSPIFKVPTTSPSGGIKRRILNKWDETREDESNPGNSSHPGANQAWFPAYFEPQQCSYQNSSFPPEDEGNANSPFWQQVIRESNPNKGLHPPDLTPHPLPTIMARVDHAGRPLENFTANGYPCEIRPHPQQQLPMISQLHPVVYQNNGYRKLGGSDNPPEPPSPSKLHFRCHEPQIFEQRPSVSISEPVSRLGKRKSSHPQKVTTSGRTTPSSEHNSIIIKNPFEEEDASKSSRLFVRESFPNSSPVWEPFDHSPYLRGFHRDFPTGVPNTGGTPPDLMGPSLNVRRSGGGQDHQLRHFLRHPLGDYGYKYMGNSAGGLIEGPTWPPFLVAPRYQEECQSLVSRLRRMEKKNHTHNRGIYPPGTGSIRVLRHGVD